MHVYIEFVMNATVRHLMIEMILETDMAKHISSLWKLEHDLEAARTTALMESDQPVANGSLSVENDHDLHPKSRASVISLTPRSSRNRDGIHPMLFRQNDDKLM